MKKTALVTGASSGIGKEIAISLAKKGYQVYGLARRVELMEELKQYGIIPISMDITAIKNIKDAVQTILEKESSIDILINNAGYGFYSALEECSIEKAKQLFDVNVFGLVEMTKAVLPTMRKQQSGIIINISSVVGKVAFPYMGWYSASKYALEGLSDSLRVELKPFKIKVVLIEPGHIRSEFGKVAFDFSDIDAVSPYMGKLQKYRNLVETNPLPIDPPESISKTVLHIINISNPKTRYTPNLDGKIATFTKKWFGDKFIDWVISSKL